MSTKSNNNKYREIEKQIAKDLGCGDNSCILGSTGGMGTNGGCCCFHERHGGNVSFDEYREDMRKVKKMIYRYRQELAKLASSSDEDKEKDSKNV